MCVAPLTVRGARSRRPVGCCPPAPPGRQTAMVSPGGKVAAALVASASSPSSSSWSARAQWLHWRHGPRRSPAPGPLSRRARHGTHPSAAGAPPSPPRVRPSAGQPLQPAETMPKPTPAAPSDYALRAAVERMSQRELHAALRSRGLGVGAVTESTRATYQRKLLLALQREPASSTGASVPARPQPKQDAHASPSTVLASATPPAKSAERSLARIAALATGVRARPASRSVLGRDDPPVAAPSPGSADGDAPAATSSVRRRRSLSARRTPVVTLSLVARSEVPQAATVAQSTARNPSPPATTPVRSSTARGHRTPLPSSSPSPLATRLHEAMAPHESASGRYADRAPRVGEDGHEHRFVLHAVLASLLMLAFLTAFVLLSQSSLIH